jgi:phage tail protein X
MNHALILLLANLSSIACVIGAIILAFHGIAGWGWFLFLAVLLHTTFSSSKTTD